MTKKFKAKNMSKLDNPKRREILPPSLIIDKIEVKKGYKIADVGCGIGYFTIPMAKFVGDEGKVYAIDINKEMLEETKKRVKEEDLNNVEMVHSGENDFKIEDNSVDMVFTSTVYHELDDSKHFLNECKRVLGGGTLVILDWNKVEEEVGPPIDHRKDVKKVKGEVEDVGFSVDNIEYIGNSFYILICR